MAKNFRKLTRINLRRLPVGKSLIEHGITFQRLENGDGVYTVNVMVDGMRIHRVVGKESENTTRTQAEEYIEKLRRDARDDRLSLPKGRKIALSFNDAATKYIDRLKEEGGKDLKVKKRRLNQHLKPFFGDKPLSKISGSDIDRYKTQRAEEVIVVRKAQIDEDGKKIPAVKRNTHEGTINRELAVLSHLFNKAIEWGWINRRPAKIRRFREERGRITYLTVEQIERLLEAAKTDQNSQIYPFILIGVATGMRRSEILSIKRENIDLDRRIIFVPQAKAGAREQPITAHLAEYLSAYIDMLPKGSKWLFPSPGAKDGHTADIRKPFRRVVTAAGMNPDEVVRHTLRHTAITHLVQAGIDLPTVKRISGHKTLIMVERYAHQNGTHIKAAMDRLEQRYGFQAVQKPELSQQTQPAQLHQNYTNAENQVLEKVG